MREVLRKCKDKKFYVFIGTVVKMTPYDRLLIRNVEVYDTAGRPLGQIDHVLTAVKPFRGRNVEQNQEVRFTGKVSKYIRKDLSEDYQVIVNRVS